ncbi:MAG: Arc family DNA-binding protein [Cyclobacteriaceae bacterium]
MKSLTLRNIPDTLLEKIKDKAREEHRTLNDEILRCLEKEYDDDKWETINGKRVNQEERIRNLKNLAGIWKDKPELVKTMLEVVASRRSST